MASLADVTAITRLINTAFQVERFFLDRDRLNAEEVTSRMEQGHFILFESDVKLRGCVYVEPRGDRAYIGLLSVDPSHQRSGLGRRLMAAAESFCRDSGCRYADLLIVNLRQELPGFYKSLGYTETGTAPFPADVATKQPCHFIRMSKALSSE